MPSTVQISPVRQLPLQAGYVNPQATPKKLPEEDPPPEEELLLDDDELLEEELEEEDELELPEEELEDDDDEPEPGVQKPPTQVSPSGQSASIVHGQAISNLIHLLFPV